MVIMSVQILFSVICYCCIKIIIKYGAAFIAAGYRRKADVTYTAVVRSVKDGYGVNCRERVIERAEP